MKDPKTEHYLDRGQWKWKYQAKVAIVDIDLKTSLENPARLLRRLDEPRAENYALAMIDGTEFPAIVLLLLDPIADYKYEIATGCHRVDAARQAEVTTFDAYIVTEPDAYRREVLIRQLNTLEGQGVSVEDRILQVLELHRKYPTQSLPQLAKEWNLKEKTIRTHWTVDQAMERGQRFGFDFVKSKLAQSSALALHAIHSDVVYQKAADFALSPGVRSSEIAEMCKEIKTTRDETSAVAIVERHIREIEQQRAHERAKHGRTSPAPANKLLGNVKRIVHQIERGIDHLHLSALAQPSMARLIFEDGIKCLKRVIDDLDRMERLKDRSTTTRASMELH
jgi:hypothetical protein